MRESTEEASQSSTKLMVLFWRRWVLTGRSVAFKVHTDIESPTWGTLLSITTKKGSVSEAVAFSLVDEAALLPQVTGKRDSCGFSKASRVLPACQGCSKLAPVPAVLAVPHRQTMEPSITSAFRRESAARLCNTSWPHRPLCHQCPGLCQQQPEWICPGAYGHRRYVLPPPEGWAGAAGSSPSLQPGVRERDTRAGCSYSAVNLRIWLEPAEDGKFRANTWMFISMSSFMLPHKISQFSGTCTAMKVVPVLLWEELS